VAVHRLRVPVILAAPIVWTGLELARGHLLTGMSMACLGPYTVRWTELIQVSDLAGAYGVSFVLMFVRGIIRKNCPTPNNPFQTPSHCNGRGVFLRLLSSLWPLLPAAAALLAVCCTATIASQTNASIAGPRIALIQGSIDVELLDESDSERKDRHKRIFDEYLYLSRKAIRTGGHIDLLVWPESMFPGILLTYEPNVPKPAW